MKKLLKKLALLPLFCGLVLTSACSNDDENGNGNDIPTSWFDGTITATVVNGNDYNDLISRVGAVTRANNSLETIATSAWSSGGFTITLPETLESRFLWSIESEFEDMPHVIISDRNARISSAEIEAFDDQNNVVGVFMNIREDENLFVMTILAYADRDVSQIGSDGYDQTWNLSLRRGWNKIYVIERETATGGEVLFTTEAVNGLRWHFVEFVEDDWFSAPMATKSTTENRSIFSRLGR